MRHSVLLGAALLAAGTTRVPASVPVPYMELSSTRCVSAGSEPDLLSQEETLHFDADPDRGASISGAYEYAGGIRITAPETLTVKAVLFYLTNNADLATVHLRGAGSEAQPGPVLDSFRTNSSGAPTWKRADLPRTVVIPAGSDFWPTVTVRHASGMRPLTLDLGPLVAWRGGYIMVPLVGQTWYQLTDPPFWTDRNWNIRAVVEIGQTGIEELLPGPRSNRDPVLSVSVFRDHASCAFRLAQAGIADISIYDQRGARVSTLLRDRLPAGRHEVSWSGRADNGAPAPSGTYFLALQCGPRRCLKRFVLLR